MPQEPMVKPPTFVATPILPAQRQLPRVCSKYFAKVNDKLILDNGSSGSTASRSRQTFSLPP